MAPAVTTSLVRLILPDFTMWTTFETSDFLGSKARWKPALWLELVPQPAESLTDAGNH
ncbi:hypothetical protein MUDAN_BIHEEGNE_01955 [Lactiplantibacillus mudanjiangensis]|uniref:Uncharacterized protein n=1 Tax=Lactiplantibacillus mudanjiangensis TaxID=1296538 RepID=A0A660DVX8_9LACO|nr:hypothetical protein MUDAN_BIHEEGNE_01955 [Lactiplantibacillus mudanjiangensis]VDG23969.1 hypothetical protein MUDAN_IGPPGNFN_00589 [Lactiplantibacillus mudanjiangensis]VDG27151.1 hypothetical protein MUDAN_MDHGFNIF_02127 [Lactiplantibacillus mudanjiangensis]